MNNADVLSVLKKKINPKETTTMDIQDILAQLKEKFGDSFDIAKVTTALKSIDFKNLNFTEIVSKLHADGLLSNVGNIENIKENVMDSLKSKAGGMLGGIFGK